MAEYADREHFIPLRRNELVDLLCADKELATEDRESFRQFCKLITAIYHFEYNQTLDRLKNAYAPFDPDTDCKPLVKWRSEERQQKIGELFSEFGWLMDRANFKHLSRDTIEPSVGIATHQLGLVVDVDFQMFERLAIFARGEGVEKRRVRRLRSLFRKEDEVVPIYKRLVMILKLRPHKRLSKHIGTEGVFLQVFKNIPKRDLLMLLPGARVRMTKIDRSKIGLPFISGLGMALYNIADDIFLQLTRVASSPTMFWGVASGAIGYGTKSYFSYVGTKQKYHLNLREVLYFQNLDTNSGVLFRLLDEAEEQDAREAILAYYMLWRFANERGWTSADLDDYIEIDLERRCNLKVDFEVSDAIAKLEKLRLVEKVDDRYRAQPIDKALQMLDYIWDNYFKYNNPQEEAAPIPGAKLTMHP
ncbi:MAG: DUF3754 domain-containing protein [Gemmataceae bacterium]|nr:DUF3754 domain-containing protein [Gemmataceae bacterium]